MVSFKWDGHNRERNIGDDSFNSSGETTYVFIKSCLKLEIGNGVGESFFMCFLINEEIYSFWRETNGVCELFIERVFFTGGFIGEKCGIYCFIFYILLAEGIE